MSGATFSLINEKPHRKLQLLSTDKCLRSGG